MMTAWVLAAVGAVAVQGEAPVGYDSGGTVERPARVRPADRYPQEVQCNWDNEPLQRVSEMVQDYTGKVIFWSPEAAAVALSTMITHRGGEREYSKEEYWELFLQILSALPQPMIAIRLPGFDPTEEEYILRLRVGTTLANLPIMILQRHEDPPAEAGIYGKLYKLEHITAADAANFIRTRFVGFQLGDVVADMATNEGQALYVVDSGHNLLRLRDMLREIDVPPPELRITVVPIMFNLADDIKTRLDPIVDIYKQRAAGRIAGGTATTPQTPPQPGQQPPTHAGATTGEMEEVISVEVEPRQNSLIVTTESPEREEQILTAIRLLDQRPRALVQYYVRPVRHVSPGLMATIINSTIKSGMTAIEREQVEAAQLPSTLQGAGSQYPGTGFGTGTGTTRPGTGTTPGTQNPIRFQQGGFPAQVTQPQPNPPSPEGEAIIPQIGPVPPQIVADENTGNLVILADPETMAMIDRIIEQMDRRRPQILLRAHIIEITAGENFELGVELRRLQGVGRHHFAFNFGTETGTPSPTPIPDPTNPGQFLGVDFPAGFTTAVLYDQVTNIVGLLNALEGVDRTRVIDEPEIFVRDGVQARISVTDEQAYRITTTQQQGVVQTSSAYAQATTTLSITPRITEHRSVGLTVGIQASNFGAQEVLDLAPPVTRREVTSTVTVPNGTTVVLGGFVTSGQREATTGVPFLREIPLLGRLFRRDVHSRNKSVLYFFLTPTIIEEDLFGDIRHETALRTDMVEDMGSEPVERVLTDIPPPPQPVEGSDVVPTPHSPYRRPGAGPRR